MSAVETEIKLRVDHADAILARIHDAGFTIHKPRVFEANNVYDMPMGSIRAAGQLLRLREAGDVSTLTWKGPAERTGLHKTRAEVETRIGDPKAFDIILRQLGYVRTFRYEKFRTEYTRPAEAGILTVDETPIGTFLELEGDGAWIDTIAARLGFNTSDYITSSYATLYVEHCYAHGRQPADMTFAA